jgi:hypothetical protein
VFHCSTTLVASLAATFAATLTVGCSQWSDHPPSHECVEHCLPVPIVVVIPGASEEAGAPDAGVTDATLPEPVGADDAGDFPDVNLPEVPSSLLLLRERRLRGVALPMARFPEVANGRRAE